MIVFSPTTGELLGYDARSAAGPPLRQSTRPDVLQQWIDRWSALRRGPLSTENLHAVVEELAAPLEEAQERNFERWREVRPNGGQFNRERSWRGEVEHLKGWLQSRADWMDRQFPDVPLFNREGGEVPSGFKLVLTSFRGAIYYTTDGSDPRRPGGGISSKAQQFPGKLVDNALVPLNAPARYFVPVDDSLGEAWKQAEFDDSGWTEAATGIGWETIGGVEELIETNIREELRGVNAGAYFRWNFNFDNASAVNRMELTVHADDGFVAYVNGRKVALRNAPDPVSWNSAATKANPDADAVAGVKLDITNYRDALRNGANVLAIHAMNQTDTGSDFLIKAGLLINETVVPMPVAIEESQTVTARVYDGRFWSGVASFGFVVGGPTIFSGDPDEDMDGDGLSAFVEYALGTDDADPMSGPGSFRSIAVGDGLRLLHGKNRRASDVSLVIERSTNLADWTEAVELKPSLETPTDEGRVQVQWDVPLVPGEDVYLRLRIDQVVE